MSYTVSFDHNDRLVIIQISRTSTFNDCCTAREEALRLCNKQHCPKLLVDIRELKNNRPSPVDCYYFGESLSYAQLPFYIAHVMPTDVTIHEDAHFIRTVAVNRGVSLKEFEDIDEARTWLMEKPDGAKQHIRRSG